MLASDPDRASAPIPELTARALTAGLGIGALLAVGNVYMGLKTGWWDSGSITASVLAFSLFSAWTRAGGRPASPLETNLAQTTAAAVGAAPAAAGLLGAIPALALMGQVTPGWIAAAWGVALGALGVLLGLALRRRLLEEERLPFPTGIATAHLIRTMHGGEGSGARVLLGSGAVAAAVTALREATSFIPAVTALPGTLAGAPAAAYGLGVAWSPLMAGAGLVVGPRNGAGVLLGAVVAWAGIGPALVRAGIVTEAAYGPVVGWLAWPGVALMLGSASVALAGHARSLPRALADLSAVRGRGLPALLVFAAAAVAVVVAVGARGFGLSLGQALVGLLLAAVLGSVCARAAGQTDISPGGDVGQLAQLGAGVLGQTSARASVGVGSVVAGAAAQTSVSLWSLRAGQELGSSPRSQALGMLAGAAVGSAIGIPAYLLLAGTHGVGTAALPVPSALPWKVLAEAASGGLAAIPRGAAAASAAAFVAGVVLELVGQTRAGRFLPAPGAIGMGFIAPAHYAVAIAAGAAAGAAWGAVRPEAGRRIVPIVAAGAIAGESLAGVATTALKAAGILGR